MKRLQMLFILPVIILIIVSCKKDEFTEEDVLKMQQETDFTVYVRDQATTYGIEGVSVTIINKGEEIVKTTNSSGAATFEDVGIGEFPIKLSKDGYIAIEKILDVDLDDRETVFTEIFQLFSINSSAVAFIEGNVKIQSDLVTDMEEHPAGTTILAIVNENYEDEMRLTSNVSENGDFKFTIPVNQNGKYVKLIFPDVMINQKLAVEKDDDSIDTVMVKTVFSPYKAAGSVPYLGSITATIPPPNWFGSDQATIEGVKVEKGKIVAISVGHPGNYYYYWCCPVTITINSPNGGSGADLQIQGQARYFYDNYIYGIFANNLVINSAGSDYPDDNPNYLKTEPSGFTWPGSSTALRDNTYIERGQIIKLDINYGTGTYRELPE